MSGIATAVVGGSIVSGYMGSKAAGKAASAEVRAAELGIEEQRRQFDAVQKLLAPYTQAGAGALASQEDLLGLNGPQAQAKALEMLQQSPEFATLLGQGEEAILQNASATGGLRGGNTQNALMRFRPELLTSLINNQFNRLGGLTQIGQASAAGVGSAGMQTGTNVSNLYGNIGSAQAGKYLAQGQAVSNVADAASTYGLLKSLKVF